MSFFKVRKHLWLSTASILGYSMDQMQTDIEKRWDFPPISDYESASLLPVFV